MSEQKKDVVWSVNKSKQYEGDTMLTVTANRDVAIALYEAVKHRSDNWTAFQLDRWENGEFVENELETDG